MAEAVQAHGIEAVAIVKSGRIFALTHNYTGYRLALRMREMIREGDLGVLQLAPPRAECRAGQVLCSVFATSSYSQCEEGAIRQRDAADGDRVKKGGKADVLSAQQFDVRTLMSFPLDENRPPGSHRWRPGSPSVSNDC